MGFQLSPSCLTLRASNFLHTSQGFLSTSAIHQPLLARGMIASLVSPSSPSHHNSLPHLASIAILLYDEARSPSSSHELAGLARPAAVLAHLRQLRAALGRCASWQRARGYRPFLFVGIAPRGEHSWLRAAFSLFTRPHMGSTAIHTRTAGPRSTQCRC